MYAHCACIQWLWSPEEGVRSFRTGVMNKQLCAVMWVLGPGPRLSSGAASVFTAKPSLQSPGALKF